MKHTDLTEICLKQELIYDGKIIRVEKDTVQLPNGHTSTREVVRHPGAVAVVAKNNDNLILVRQYRYAFAQETLEIPAGKIDPGEKPEICAVRELREETGYRGDMEFLGVFNTSPGFADEIIYIYFARNLEWSPLKADDDEFLGVLTMPWSEAVSKAYNGEFRDAKTTLGILLTYGKAL